MLEGSPHLLHGLSSARLLLTFLIRCFTALIFASSTFESKWLSISSSTPQYWRAPASPFATSASAAFSSPSSFLRLLALDRRPAERSMLPRKQCNPIVQHG